MVQFPVKAKKQKDKIHSQLIIAMPSTFFVQTKAILLVATWQGAQKPCMAKTAVFMHTSMTKPNITLSGPGW